MGDVHHCGIAQGERPRFSMQPQKPAVCSQVRVLAGGNVLAQLQALADDYLTRGACRLYIENEISAELFHLIAEFCRKFESDHVLPLYRRGIGMFWRRASTNTWRHPAYRFIRFLIGPAKTAFTAWFWQLATSAERVARCGPTQPKGLHLRLNPVFDLYSCKPSAAQSQYRDCAANELDRPGGPVHRRTVNRLQRQFKQLVRLQWLIKNRDSDGVRNSHDRQPNNPNRY